MAQRIDAAVWWRPVAGALAVGGVAVLALRLRSRRRKPENQRGRVVVLGLGYCGSAVARYLAQEAGFEVVGTVRSEADPVNTRAGVRSIILDGGSSCREELVEALRGAVAVIATAPPGEAGDPFLADVTLAAALLEAGRAGTTMIYLSSVGVYGDQGGRLVTEETPPAPVTARAKRRLAAEDAWRSMDFGRLAIVRLPGIYGPGRGPMAKANEGNMLIVKEGHVFSRIHVDDLLQLCKVLVERANSRCDADTAFWKEGAVNIINCCDSEPAPQHEVSALAYKLLGRKVPDPVPFDIADLSPMQRSFYEESRHMGNAKMLDIVGSLRYPSYREGLPACLGAGSPGSYVVALVASGLATATRLASPRTWLGLLLSSRKVTRIALVDNGSLKPEATLSLRRLARGLEDLAKERGERICVEAVSARYSDRIPARDLGGRKGEVMSGWLAKLQKMGCRDRVLLLPLLIGPSTTVTGSMPDAARAAPEIEIEICPPLVCLCPALFTVGLSGAAEMAGMLSDRLEAITTADWKGEQGVVLLCDHGSPVKRVAAAREAVRVALERRLGFEVMGCCMERREGPDFDFNGPLLEDALAEQPKGSHVAVALLFLQEGKHAGPGGDVLTIVAGVAEKRPDLKIATTSVLAGHPGLLELLLRRTEKAVPVRLFP
mmetsp:Transcript_65266/g.142117  ORF Transcript_65266/g.142117 Transcript_65266/m.142117 type:complete len:661 (+) Transcript_65266:45-2027(+)